MALVRTESGGELDTETLPKDSDDLVRAVLDHAPVFDPLDAEEAEVDPANFEEELQDYLREAFRLKKGSVPGVSFRSAGRIGHVAYWVFSAEPVSGYPVYLFVVRNDYVTEVTCTDQTVTFVEKASQDLHNRVLTPVQAALVEYCLNDFNPPPMPTR